MKKEIILSQELVEKLKMLPEDGMGYQIVNLLLSNGEVLYDVMIFNGKIAIVDNHINSEQIKGVLKKK